MPFLLINASETDDGFPTESNGEVINELGDGTVLSLNYPPNRDEGEPPDLPPFDVQFDPEGIEGIGSVEFTIRKGGDEIEDSPITDNYAPYAVSKAQDGVFEPPDFLNRLDEPERPTVEVTIKAVVYAEPGGSETPGNAYNDFARHDSPTSASQPRSRTLGARGGRAGADVCPARPAVERGRVRHGCRGRGRALC